MDKALDHKAGRGLGRLELVFSEIGLPVLRQTAFYPTGGRGGIVVPFRGYGGLAWCNAAIALSWCFIDYRIWGQIHDSGDYELSPRSHPSLFDALCNLLDTPRDFVLIFESKEQALIPGSSGLRAGGHVHLLKLIFMPPYRGAKRQVRINRSLLPPGKIVIRRSNSLIPESELPEFSEAIRSQFRPTNRGKMRHCVGRTDGPGPRQRRLMSHLGDVQIRASVLNDHFLRMPLGSLQCWLELGLAEKQATDAQWQRVRERAASWLEDCPGDLLVRGTALWLTLARGNFPQMFESVSGALEWILNWPGAGREMEPSCHYPSESMMTWLHPVGPLPVGHLEDNLVRAAFLRWLRTQGNSSPTGELALKIEDLLKMKGGPGVAGIIAPILEERHVARAFERANELICHYLPRRPQNALLNLASLWIIGRRGDLKQARDFLEDVAHWLNERPEAAQVMAAWIWLAGFRGSREQCERAIDQAGKWLEEEAHKPDCMVRSAWLWLVGLRGTAAQADRAAAQTYFWLETHPEDSLVRSAYLLFLVRRRGTELESERARSQTRVWLQAHPQDALLKLAIDYFERATMS